MVGKNNTGLVSVKIEVEIETLDNIKNYMELLIMGVPFKFTMERQNLNYYQQVILYHLMED